MRDAETLLLELGMVTDLLTVAFDMHGQVRPRIENAAEHQRLGCLLLLLRDRAGQLHERAGFRPSGNRQTDCFDSPHREG